MCYLRVRLRACSLLPLLTRQVHEFQRVRVAVRSLGSGRLIIWIILTGQMGPTLTAAQRICTEIVVNKEKTKQKNAIIFDYNQTYSAAAVDDASLLCIVQSHLLVSFGCSNVLLVSEKQFTRCFKIWEECKLNLEQRKLHKIPLAMLTTWLRLAINDVLSLQFKNNDTWPLVRCRH